MDLVLISPAEARNHGLKRYFTGKPCKNGHVAERLTVNGTCLRCMSDTFKRWREGDAERYVRVMGGARERWMERNPDWTKVQYERHRDKKIAASQRWADGNRAKVRDIKRQWKRRNPEWVDGWARKRAQTLGRATPAWLTDAQLAEIAAIYREARARGPDWHVDHIVPLHGKTVCGLHVPWNLQILTKAENLAKGARLAA